MTVFLGFGIGGALIAFLVIMLNKHVSTRMRVATSIFFGLFAGFSGWLFLPTLNFWFIAPWFFLFFIIMGAIIVSVIYTEKMPDPQVYIAITVVLGIAVFPTFTSWSALHASDYHELMPEPVTSRFADDVSPVDIRQIRIVDQELAHRLGEKRLGEIPGLGSRVELGTMNIQLIDGCFDILDGRENTRSLCLDDALFWAGPLKHSGVNKQWTFGHTPGYVLVSATNMSDIYMVTAVRSVDEESTDSNDEANPRMGNSDTLSTGEFDNLELRYFPDGGYFDKYLLRHLRTHGYMSEGLTDFTFEVSNDGNPYWVVTKYVHRVGFSGSDAVGVLVVDAQTGDINEYSVDNAPEWIDRIQPEELVREQLNDQGKFVHGWMNSWWGKRDLRTTTEGMSLVYGADGKSYWYTGVQSAGADEGTMGFMLVDTRTKEPRWYQIAGATETAARASAENAPGAREAEYSATNPILYNVGGVPTYFMTLKGDDGLVKMFAFVSVQNYETLGVGRSLSSALRNYQSALSSQGQDLSADDLVDRVQIEAVVADVAIEEGFYYIRLEGINDKEFYGSSVVSPELKWTRPGDTVVLTYDESGQSSVLIVRFNNTGLNIR
ncbi:MAG: sulfite exporter TauE/SafE family protein [Candidatus Spechtbacterales bacterium]|nr:sulfite exporter TauE/SafE family protein [Candidatus Spechtbacterales bacterium]